MPEHQSHYPDFDVLREEKHWDPHTREIVTERVNTEHFQPYRSLTPQEAETLFRLCTLLMDDERASVMDYIVHHFDSSLKSDIGESQRKAGVPKQSTLIRNGLARLDQVCSESYGARFTGLAERDQQEVVHRLAQGDLNLRSEADSFPVRDWFDKMLTETVAAYYSHPTVWSEIGYAGPAYPRGYVRSELGLTDPWEAKRNGK